jgi:hypothetical protein
MTEQKATNAASATTPPEQQPAPWAYQEEPYITPAEKPAPPPPVPAREQQQAPWSYRGASQGDPATWAYKEEPDVEEGSS